MRGGGTVGLDLAWNHDFQLTKATGDKAKVLSTGISSFNVLNHTNYTGYIGALSAKERFMQPTAALNGRQMQFSIGYRF